jgi:hypothetical protein
MKPSYLTMRDSRYIAAKNVFFQNLVSLGVPMNEKDRFGDTMLMKLLTQNCYHEQNASLSFLRRLAENGAEFEVTDWDKTWSNRFSRSLYDYNYDDAGPSSCLPKLMVEAMQVVVEFAEGETKCSEWPFGFLLTVQRCNATISVLRYYQNLHSVSTK